VKGAYSSGLSNALQALLSGDLTASAMFAVLADRAADEFESALAGTDALHSHLRNEFENGRLLRLLFKLGHTDLTS